MRAADWLYWKCARLLFRAENVDGIAFLDLRGLERPDQVRATLSEALETLRLASSGHDQLVLEEVAFVAATLEKRARAPLRSRAYLSPFTGPERWNSQLLAARLVWAAVLFREARKARQSGVRLDLQQAEQQARREQRALVERLPNSERWVEYLHLEEVDRDLQPRDDQ